MTNNTAHENSILDHETITKELYKRNVELHKERKRTEELLYRVSEAIYAVDESCRITLFNHALERLMRVKAADVLGMQISEIISLTDEEGTPLDINRYCS